jgi:hypothetical protein
MNRRQYLTATAVVAMGGVAGCSEGGAGDPSGNDPDQQAPEPEYSGTANDTTEHNVEASPGATIRIEVENAEGPITSVIVHTPDGETVVDEQVETDSTITHTAESEGVFRVFINSSGRSPYEIYVDGGTGETSSEEADRQEGEPEHSGTTSDRAQHTVEVSTGETIRVETENVEGPRTTVTVVDPNGDAVLQEQVETTATLTHTAESGGVFRVMINSTGTSSYEIYVDTE